MDSQTLARELDLRVRILQRRLRRDAPYGTNISALLVLGRLDEGGPARVTELAEFADVAQPTMTTLVRRLESHGLVRRRRDPSDGRAALIELTDEGIRRIDHVLEVRRDALQERLQRMTPQDLKALEKALAPLGRLADL